jgi:outer membrane lipoprotein SlyB
VVNSVLIGGVLGLAVQAGTGTLAASAVAVITGAGALAAHLIRQREIWLTARQRASSPTGAAGR